MLFLAWLILQSTHLVDHIVISVRFLYRIQLLLVMKAMPYRHHDIFLIHQLTNHLLLVVALQF